METLMRFVELGHNRLSVTMYSSTTLHMFSMGQGLESGELQSSSTLELGVASHSRAECEYELVAVLVHAGTADGGHYYSYIKNRTQQGVDSMMRQYATLIADCAFYFS